MSLPDALYSVAQVRDIDARAIAAGTPAYELMQRAGAAALRMLVARWPAAQRIAVVCGPGNKGGDGYVLARLLRQSRYNVDVLAVADPSGLQGPAREAWEAFSAAGNAARAFDAAVLSQADVVVDAFLGTGLRLPLRETAAAVVAAINACGRPVLSLDVPSGLDADRGDASQAVRAAATVSFIALKTGLLVGDGPSCTGELGFDSLAVQIPPDVMPRAACIGSDVIRAALPARPRNAHKAACGRVLLVGGGAGMPGAVRLAAESALQVGAGLVTVASLPEHLLPVVGARPELMFHALPNADALPAALAQADVVAVGPGLGRDAWAQAVFETLLAHRRLGQFLILDADALNLLAARSERLGDADWILTPHPGEAARLLGCETATVQADRLAALDRLVAERGGVIILKGAGTLLGTAGQVHALCRHGNPGMAVPGMGDVLTGALAGILAQCRDPWLAARAAVQAHALAGDRVARDGERGVLAGAVGRALRDTVNA